MHLSSDTFHLSSVWQISYSSSVLFCVVLHQYLDMCFTCIFVTPLRSGQNHESEWWWIMLDNSIPLSLPFPPNLPGHHLSLSPPCPPSHLSPTLPSLSHCIGCVMVSLSLEVHGRWSAARWSPECPDQRQDTTPPPPSPTDGTADTFSSQACGPHDGADPASTPQP